MRRLLTFVSLAGLLWVLAAPASLESACCYFSAKDKDILQPAQKAFITWDPVEKVESFTVQPKFEGNALDFGMVIPTPSRPKLDEMPKDFFKELAVYTILKNRLYPDSNLLPRSKFALSAGADLPSLESQGEKKPSVKVLEAGVVGSLDYKIIEAGRADDLFTWLKDNKYSYAGDEATLDFYIKKKWLFTVMKIDTMQMKKAAGGTYAGEVTPTRFQFASEQLVYPLKITQLSVRDQTEALFYVQAPYKVDLTGDLTYQFQWVSMVQNARGWYQKGIFGTNELPGKADEWLKAIEPQIPGLFKKRHDLGFDYVAGLPPVIGAPAPPLAKEGQTATTLEWAKRLTANDIKVLTGQAPYTEKVPNVDEGFTDKDLADPKKREEVYKKIQERIDKDRKARPGGYLVREVPEADVKQLKILAGHLQAGQFVTKFRKTFTKGEMNDDLLIVPAKLGSAEDISEYEEILPTSPP